MPKRPSEKTIKRVIGLVARVNVNGPQNFVKMGMILGMEYCLGEGRSPAQLVKEWEKQEQMATLNLPPSL